MPCLEIERLLESSSPGLFLEQRPRSGGVMRELMRSTLVLFVFLLLCGTSSAPSWAAAAKSGFDEKAIAEFYKGKTVRIIVGFSAGGGYDAYSRLIGRHLHKHIPGNPNVLVDNMAGAGGLYAATPITNT